MNTCKWFVFFISAFLGVNYFDSAAQPSKLSEQNIVFNKLPDELGLAQSSINSILQDRDGYLWIATWSGLIRYDGYTSLIFHSSNEEGAIKSNLISTLFEDRNGNIWVGTHMGGLFEYNKQTNKFINYNHDSLNKHSISNNNIWKIIEDDHENLWIATENGLNFFDKKTQSFTSFLHDPANASTLSGNFVTDVFFSHDKNLWIATNNGVSKLLILADGKHKFERYYDRSGDIADNFAYAIEEITQQHETAIWFITKKGLKKISNGRLENFTYEDKTPNCSLFRSMLKVNGEKPFLLLGSAMGLSLFDIENQIFTRFIGNFDNLGITSANESMYITSLYIDRGGVLWVGTKKGLYKSNSYKKNFKLHLTSTFDKTNSIISGIESAGEKSYWISTIGGGLFKLQDDKFVQYTLSSNRKKHFINFIQSLFKDSKGNVWIGTAGAGVISFHPNDSKNATITKFIHYHTSSSPSISDDYIVSFAEDKQGAIWVGTWSGGLIKISSDGTLTQYSDAFFSKAPIVVMHTDNSGALWIGTRGNGIYRLRPKVNDIDVKHFKYTPNDTTSLCNDFVNDIYEDHAGDLWIGTEGGLTHFDRRTEAFNYFTIKDGPSIRVIVGILEDDKGKLWLSHWTGITMIDPADGGQYNTKNFDQHDRIQGGFYFNNVCYKDAAGNLLFGGSNGLNIINTAEIIQNPLRPNVQITQFKLFNKTVGQNELIDKRVLIDKALGETEIITLKHNENAISFEFAALDYAAPEKIRYEYMLEGFDTDWNFSDASRRYANYTNLNPGSYTFKVKATNNDGLWSDKIRELKIEIKLPWWKTKLAMAIYGLLSILTMLGFKRIVLIRTNFIHDIKLERLQRENMEKLNKAKLQFFTNISHEFRTPLTLILGPVQSLIESRDGGKFMQDHLFAINNNAQRLARLVNQLLDFRKAETGNLKLEVIEGNLAKFAKEIKLSFEALAEKMKIDFTFSATSNIIKAWFDPDQFEKILYNLISNSFKHTLQGGRISIKVVQTKNSVSIVVEDNGKGIKPENFGKIFHSFFSYDEDRHYCGSGIGLALVKSLVDAHHGTIHVESQEKVSTRFIVTIPLGNAHFDTADLAKTKSDTENIEHYPPFYPETFSISEGDPLTINTNIEKLHKILIVEDSEEVRKYIMTIFSTNYVVLEAENGKDGLNIALEESPDVIISDVMMPLMDGIALCKVLKSNVSTSHIPIILLTARTSLIFKIEGLETGADDYVSKPFNPKILQLKVRNLLRARDAMQKVFRDQEVLQIEPRKVTLNSTDEKFVQQILESIEKNMSNTNFSVDDLSVDIGMSRTQLYRKLKAVTGYSANELIRTIRLKRAAQLLENDELTIAEVTYEVGFNDLQYFRECFKKLFSLTPSEYSQKNVVTKLKKHTI